MERKFYQENFESSLKEDADQFKMYPSKRVWHGIYNSVHPGRKWPSIAISFLFIFTFVIVGQLNTGTSPGKLSRSLSNTDINKTPNPKVLTASSHSQKNQNGISAFNRLIPGFNQNHITTAVKITDGSQNNATPGSAFAETSIVPTQPIDESKEAVAGIAINRSVVEEHLNSPEDIQKSTINNDPGIENKASLDMNKSLVKTVQKEADDSKNLATVKQATATTHLKSRVSWTIFVTPALSYRTYSQGRQEVLTNRSMNPFANNSNNQPAIERPSLGISGGSMVNYDITKKLKFVAGIQFGYSEFNKKATNVHPTIATLILRNSVTGEPYTLTSFSHYGNRVSAAEFSLHNYSFETSAPVGIQYTVGGSNKIKLDVLATFQPTYVLGNQAYLLSSNDKYFISDPGLSRKWNMAISLGTLLSFASDSYRWLIGPNIDYHLLSTYDARYPIKEHIINYGLRVGMTRIRR